MAFTYFTDLKERLNRPGGPPFYFRVANLVVAVLMIIVSIVFFTWKSFPRIMLGIFEILLAVGIIMFEVANMESLKKYVLFMFTWRGRGCFYIFFGCLTLGHNAWGWIFGSIITGIGVVYVVLSYTTKKNENYVMDAAPSAAGGVAYNDSSLPVHNGAAGGYPAGGQYQGSAQYPTSTQYPNSSQYGNSGSIANPSMAHAPQSDYLHNPI
ncbi:hypothetical protein EC988_005517 [Linderina pennispora]|nr:hypothetical protein EC988_005517 [Linderina pennispora]